MGNANLALVKLAAHLPLPVCHALGGALGWLASVVPNGARRVTDVNLRLCLPEQPARERRRLRRASLMHTGRMALESGRIWLGPTGPATRMVRDTPGIEHLDRAWAGGRGVILAAPHLGCWEVLVQYLAARYPLTVLYRPQGGGLDEVMRQGRGRTGATLVSTDRSGVRSLLAALQRGEAVGILPDRDGGREGGIYAEFFGQPANTSTLVPKLAARTGAAVVFVYGERLPRGRGYRVHCRPGSAAIGAADPVAGARALNRDLEACIRELPEQYWWSYKRFRRAPPGQAGVYQQRWA